MSSQQVPQVTSAPVRTAALTGNRTSPPPADAGNNAAASGKVLPPDKSQSPAPGASLDKAVSEINDYVQTIQRDLRFSVDQDSGRTVVKIIDSKSKEVIRQIPSEEALNLAHRLEQLRDGTILRVKA